ncbi:MAG: hypothetical protein ACOC88_02635 [Candidatus Bipolaricaulota bacterium]
MGIFNWFSASTEEKEEKPGELVRYLCTFDREYSDLDEFLDDFFEILNEAIDRYNEANPVNADKLDRDKVYKIGGNWAFDANVERREGEEVEAEGSTRDFYRRKSTFKIIAREQPHYALELSGSQGLISPFLTQLEKILDEKNITHEVATIAKPNLGKAK